MLADIGRSLAVLAAPTKGLPVHASHSTQGVTPVGGTASEQGRSEPNPPGASQDPTTQALLEVSQMLSKLSAPPAPPPRPTTPWASDSFQSSVQDLKRQVEALATARVVPSLQVSTASPCVSLAPGSLTQTPQVEKEHGKGNEQGVSATKPLASAEGSGVDTLLSRPGKLAAHVAPEIKEKIWKREFVDIFSLVRAKRREVETKEKDAKSSAFGEKKQKIEENITNWLFGYNVFMSVMLEKKPEIGIAMIFYGNKILKAHHAYGGNAWLEYDRDFRWAKVEDPAIGWDQTEVNVWLECVNNKLPTKQPFRAQYANDKKGLCWAFNRKICSRPTGTCKFRHSSLCDGSDRADPHTISTGADATWDDPEVPPRSPHPIGSGLSPREPGKSKGQVTELGERTADGRRGFLTEATEDPLRRLVRPQGSRRLLGLSAPLENRARAEQGITAVPTRDEDSFRRSMAKSGTGLWTGRVREDGREDIAGHGHQGREVNR
ncbi:hypothetical protein NDU88_006511 [Pleurodeles waltl]|uniref:C3H1-type domain-containing protein n=1 Tax=Pleurodeles waltl TaxID=8319 RepID=A0AAV7QHX4_PLEWA|nr:hypothetical protein NDU88_006511 [Pleurodeles waltl]